MDTPPVIIRLLEELGLLKLTFMFAGVCWSLLSVRNFARCSLWELIWFWRTFKFSLLKTPNQGVGLMVPAADTYPCSGGKPHPPG